MCDEVWAAIKGHLQLAVMIVTDQISLKCYDLDLIGRETNHSHHGSYARLNRTFQVFLHDRKHSDCVRLESI